MIRQYEFINSEESHLFFTSDTHWRHAKLLRDRGFSTIEEHDETEINNWNSVVRPQDVVIHLGDFVLGAGNDSQKVCEELFRRLNGTIYLLFGNHLAGIKQIYKESVKAMGLDGENFEVYPVSWQDYPGHNKVIFVGNSILAKVKDKTAPKHEKSTQFIFCSHFAHRIWIDYNRDVWHCCGHSHKKDKESNPDWPINKRLDCGVDNFNFTPVSYNEVKRIMDRKQFQALDHHDKNTNPSF